MILALHTSGLAFVALIFFSLVIAYGLITLMDDDQEEDRWLP